MTDENPAAEVESTITLDSEIDNAINDDAIEDSAPQEEDAPEVEKPEQQANEESQKEEVVDGFQARINKVTEDKWNEKRRADALQAEIDKLKSKQDEPKPVVQPKLEDFDYDEQAYNEALIDYKVDVKAQAIQDQQLQQSKNQEKIALMQTFNDNSATFAKDKPDFTDVLNRVPTLQPSVLEEVMSQKNGPELAYFLGNHLDIADSIVKMNPVAAGIKIGEISRKLSEPKQIKPSKAPEPIDPLRSGGSISNERGPQGATFE